MDKRQNNRSVGSAYEDRAAEFLKDNGLTILHRNYRCRMGEIDIIAKDEEYIVFVEVKYRETDSHGQPEEAVGFAKQRTICNVARHYIMTKGYSDITPVRFDVLGITPQEIKWYKAAFECV